MEHYGSLHHTKWECKYHLVWIPKSRKKVLYGQLRRDLGQILRRLATQKESEVIEGIPPDRSRRDRFGYPQFL